VTLESRLERWVGAGLVTAEQAERILAFERAEAHAAAPPRPTLLYAIAGLGALAIAVGLASIVAANWDGIPARVKIGIDLALVAGLGAGVWQLDRRGPGWARETAIVVLWGLVLASIALVGQVYQLGGRADEALLSWSVLTALLMTRARSGFAAVVWIVGLQATWIAWAVRVADEWHSEEIAIATIYAAPLLCVALGRLPPLARARPALARALVAIGWGELMLCATIGTFAFYGDMSTESWHEAYPVAASSAVLTAAVAIGLVARMPERVLLVACFVFAHVPFFTSTGDLDVVAAASFVALWLVVAWTAHDAGDAGVLNAATALVGVRIVAVYFEVFGTLLDTGLGLVTGGLLTLAIAWLWARKRRQFAAELGQRGPA
jgi:uncharacterized membrane protein